MCVITTFVFLTLTACCVGTDPYGCLSEDQKNVVAKFKATQEIRPLLEGKKFTEIWKRKETSDFVDCAWVDFKWEKESLFALIYVLKHNAKHSYFYETWTEIKGEGRFSVAEGYLPDPLRDHSRYTTDIQFFYADENAIGTITCGLKGGWRMTIAVREDKMNEDKTTESLAKAVKAMDQMKPAFEGDMAKLARAKCPDKL